MKAVPSCNAPKALAKGCTRVPICGSAFEQYFALHQKDPLINCIWSVVQTDAELQSIDIEDTLQNARHLHPSVRQCCRMSTRTGSLQPARCRSSWRYRPHGLLVQYRRLWVSTLCLFFKV